MSSGGGKDAKAPPTLLTKEDEERQLFLLNMEQLATLLGDPQIADLPVTVIGSEMEGDPDSSINLFNFFIPALEAMESGIDLDHYDFNGPNEQNYSSYCAYHRISFGQAWLRPFVVTIGGQRRVVVLIKSNRYDSDSIGNVTNLSYLLASTNILKDSSAIGRSSDEYTLEGATIVVKEAGNFGFTEEGDSGDDSGPKTKSNVVTRFVLPKRRERYWLKSELNKEFVDGILTLLKHALKRKKTVNGAPLSSAQLAECLQRLAALYRQNPYPTLHELREAFTERSGNDPARGVAMRCAVQHYVERFRETESEAERLEQDARWRAEATCQVLDQIRAVGAARVDLLTELNRAIDAERRRPVQQAVEQSAQKQKQTSIPDERPIRVTEEEVAQMSEEDIAALIAQLEAERTRLGRRRDGGQSKLDGVHDAMEKSDLETKRIIKLTPCLVCKKQLCEIVFQPCWHGICQQCFEIDDNVCPVCNQTTTGFEEL